MSSSKKRNGKRKKVSTYASFGLEHELFSSGYSMICGVDEVGRGCLAGPVYACAVCINPNSQKVLEVNDSKKLSEKRREHLFSELMESVADCSFGYSTNEEIDEKGIVQSTKLAMLRSYWGLRSKPDVVIVDGADNNFFPCNTIAQKKADFFHYTVAAASVLAKVYRDNIMKDLDSEYPLYGFAKHVGYGTKEHMSAIRKYGSSVLHRKSFLGFLKKK